MSKVYYIKMTKNPNKATEWLLLGFSFVTIRPVPPALLGAQPLPLGRAFAVAALAVVGLCGSSPRESRADGRRVLGPSFGLSTQAQPLKNLCVGAVGPQRWNGTTFCPQRTRGKPGACARTHVLLDLTKTRFCAIVPVIERMFYGGALPGTWHRIRNGARERCSPQQVASTVFFCTLHTCGGAA
jgi:hypothetical protein